MPAVRRQGERNCADGRGWRRRLEAALGSHRGWRSHPCRHPWHGGEQRRVGEGRLHSAWRGGAGSGDSRGNGHRRCGGSRHFVHPRPRHRDASRGPDRDRCALAGVRTWNPRRPLCDRISEGQHRTREYGRGCGRAHDDRARPRTSASTADGEFREPKPRHPFADSPSTSRRRWNPGSRTAGPASRVSAHLGWVARTRMRCSRSRRSVRPAIPYRTTASCLFRPEQRALSKRRQRASPTGSRVTPRRHSPTSPSRFRSAGVASLIAGSWSVVPSRRASPHSASPWRSQSSLASTKPASAPLPSCSRAGCAIRRMARGLYEREPEFRDCLDRCASVLQDKLGGDIRALLFPASEDTHESAERELAQTRWTQPCLFAIEMALAKLLASWGIKPTACVGHSVGEFAAACVAGVFSLEDGLTLVADRARLMQSVPPGRMLAVVMGRANSHRCWATGFRWRR